MSNAINLYTACAHDTSYTRNGHRKAVPFIHPIKLKNQTGEVIHVRALFDDGTMSSAMCTTVFHTIKHHLKGWQPSTQTLQMADGTTMKAEAEWTGTIRIRDTEITGSFLVFNSSGGWAFLLGKPLLIAFKAIHEYETNTVTIGNSNSHTTLNNRFHDRTHLCIAGDQNHTLDIKQIATASTTTQWTRYPQTTQVERLQRTTQDTSLIANDPNTVQTYATELSKELEENTFTQQTEPFKSQQVEYILKSIKMGDNITWEERTKAEALVGEYANVFACSLSEVLLIPGARVNLNIPADAKLSTSIKQRPLSPLCI